MATARASLGGAGTLQAGLGFGGETTAHYCSHRRIHIFNQRDHSSSVGERREFGHCKTLDFGGAGTQTAGLAFGGIVTGT
jgi:hypothetical protein